MEINFNETIKELKSKYPEYEIDPKDCKCPDQIVSTLVLEEDTWKLNDNNIINEMNERINLLYYKNARTILKNIIVIILESPHIEEYKDIIGPLKGASGKSFNRWFETIVGKNLKATLNREVRYNILFINSVQYQCSLGMKPIKRNITDFTWLDIWNKRKGKEDFIERLKFLNPDIIFNFCTNGNNNINYLVLKELMKNSPDKDIFLGPHPVRWTRNENSRVIVKVN